MKEIILEYLETCEPDCIRKYFNTIENTKKYNVIKKSLQRRLLIHGWKSKIIGLHINNIHNPKS